jgi:hypothetical protein
MIESLPPRPDGWVSAVEEVLRRWLDESPRRTFVLADFPRHGCPDVLEDSTTIEESGPTGGVLPTGRAPSGEGAFIAAEPCGRAGVSGEPAVEPETASFARLLEVGAGHLAASAAYREQCRQAAVQARELAGFAAARPAVVLDRAYGEGGPRRRRRSRARPAVLTAVSEWAVDEVMVAFGLSAQAAGELLAVSVALVQRLPATLAALEAGRIGWNQARALAEIVAPVAGEVRARWRRGCWSGRPGRPCRS